MKISPIMSQICQSRLIILPNKKYTVKNLPKTCKLLPTWQNFAKSGHTASVAGEEINCPLLRIVYSTSSNGNVDPILRNPLQNDPPFVFFFQKQFYNSL